MPGPKNVRSRIFEIEKNFCSTFFFVQTVFPGHVYKKILDPKKHWIKKIVGSKTICGKRVFDKKKIWGPTNFSEQKMLN